MYTGVTNINFKMASINWEMSYMNNLFLKINKFRTVVKHVAYSYAIAINLLSVDIAHPQTNCRKFRIVAQHKQFPILWYIHWLSRFITYMYLMTNTGFLHMLYILSAPKGWIRFLQGWYGFVSHPLQNSSIFPFQNAVVRNLSNDL